MANGRIGVLYTDTFQSGEYHILTSNSNHHYNNTEIIRLVLSSDRQSHPDNYTVLLFWMRKLNIDRLWVHPDNRLSVWVTRNDFRGLDGKGGCHWFVPGESEIEHPIGAMITKQNEPARYIFFPAYMDLKRKHELGEPDWYIPSAMHLYNTVNYLAQVTHTPFLWGPGYSSKKLLRNIHSKWDKKVFPFMDSDIWAVAYKNVVQRPSWSVTQREWERGEKSQRKRKKGLQDFQKIYKYVHGFDKNMQYLGAARSLKLPLGGYHSALPSEYNKKVQGLWEYELISVSGSMFNSYDCFCPLKIKGSWASTSLLHAAMLSGITLNIKRGIVFEDCYPVLDEWVNTIWGGRKELDENDSKFTDRIAATNARETMKKFYIDMIGRFCREYSQEYYHPEWNALIIQESMSRQLYTLLSRQDEIKGKIVLVSNDAFFLLSNEPDVHVAYPSLLKYVSELRGYKHTGTCELTDDIIQAFEAERPPAIEEKIKSAMKIRARGRLQV